MSYADYRQYLPSPEESRVAGETSEQHAAGRLATPRARELFRQWGTLADRPFVGITTDGKPIADLFTLNPEKAPSEKMATAAWKLLDSLTPEEKRKTHHPIDSPLWLQWQNTEIFVEKHGLRLEQTSRETRELTLEVLRVSLSAKGYENTVGVMRLNAFLGTLLKAPGVFSEWTYNFCLFGKPSISEPWGWQIWGHHLSVSCLTLNGQMVLTPCFLGAEICYADQGPYKGLALFKDHDRLGLELMNSLPAKDQQRALISKSMSGEGLPKDRVHFADYLMLGGAYRDNRVVPYEGLITNDFSPHHRNRLLDLVNAYIGNLPEGPRNAKMAEFERHLSDTHFCWIGGTGHDDPFYYRIQSPVIFIEFDHHPGVFLTNKKPMKHHVHTIVRTPNGNDYGIDLLRQHYNNSHLQG
ncbi:MAG: DUF3500 domain-containing protein [Syntrophaceae bacterium]|nr:DUF3500 domain-containing protein [Syntrophaceae bacterium]